MTEATTQTFDREQFVQNYVDAAIAQDGQALEELPKQVEELSASERVSVIEDIIEKLEEHEDQNELIGILKETVGMLKLTEEVQQDSSGEQSGESTEAEAADAVEAADPAAVEASQESEAETDGTDSAVEEEESQDTAIN